MKRYVKKREEQLGNQLSMDGILKKVFIIVMISLIILNNPYFDHMSVVKAASQISVSVNYIDETITINPGVGPSTKFFMSMDKKTWETLETNTIDISSILSSRAVTLYFKGNKDTDMASIELQAEDKSFKPVFKITSGKGRIEFFSALPVQYRKGTNGTWTNITSPMDTSIYETKGATLYFRTAPTVYQRAGKPATIVVPKKTSAPSVRLDGSKLYISGLKSGVTQYRVGDNQNWSTFTSTNKTNYLELASLLSSTYIGNAPIPAGTIEFRTQGTDKKLNSSIKVIDVAQQESLSASMVSLSGTTLKILDTDTSKAYEYTIVSRGNYLDMAKARWSPASARRAVVLRKVNIGDKVLVRVKSTVDKNTKQIILASTYVEQVIESI